MVISMEILIDFLPPCKTLKIWKWKHFCGSMDFFVCYFCVGSPSIAGRHVFSTGSQMSTKDWKMAVTLVHHQFQFNVKMVKHKCHHGHNHHSTTHHNQGHLVDHDHDEGEEEAHLSQEAALVGGGSRGPVGGTCIPRNRFEDQEERLGGFLRLMRPM